MTQAILKAMGIDLWQRKRSVVEQRFELVVLCNEALEQEGSKAAQLLKNMLGSINLDQTQVAIKNSSQANLKQQLLSLKPKLILALGCKAAQPLLNNQDSLENLRGNLHYYGEGKEQVPMLVTYDPVDLLAQPEVKRLAYRDLLLVKKQI